MSRRIVRRYGLKTAQGKLALLAFCLLMAALLFLPMRAGQEDSLRLTPGALKMSVGGSYQISCALSSDDMNQRLRFYSEDSRVATIQADGTVLALASGETVIHAEASGGATAELKVTVDGVPLRELKLNASELHIDKGQISGLKASYNADASDTRLKWVSADETIATVDNAGRIEGVGGGTTWVSVVAPNGLSASARVYVEVEGTAVHISPNDLILGVGASVPLKLSYLPLDCTDSVQRWASSNPEVLTVDEDGVLHANGVGTAYVTVLTKDRLTAGMEVKVEPAPKDLQLDPTRATLERGDTLEMQVMFLAEDGSVDAQSDHLVVWSSEDPSVATVDSSGCVTALKSGSTRISATADGFTASCRLQVQVTIQEILLDHDEVYLLKEDSGTPIQLKWVISPVDVDDPTVRFESDNEQVAQVTKDGLVTMTGGYGTAVITAYSDSGASARFTVNVVTQLPEAEPEPTEEPPAQGAYGEYSAEDGRYADGDELYSDADDFYTGGDDFSPDGDDVYDDGFSQSDLYEDNIYGETPPPGGEAP